MRLAAPFALFLVATACGGDDSPAGTTPLSADAGDASTDAAPVSPDGEASAPVSDAPLPLVETGARDGSTPDAPPDVEAGPSLPLDQYCDALSNWYYDYLGRCYEADAYPESGREAYVGQTLERCLYARAAVDGGRLSYDGEAAARCVSAYQNVGCFGSFESIAECENVFAGRIAIGGDCYDDETRHFLVGENPCAEGLCLGDSCPQTCVAYPDVGDGCIQGRCGPEHYCDSDDRCRPRIARGKPCEGGDCASGLVCSDAGDSRICLPSAAIGSACSDEVACNRPGVCVEGSCQRVVGDGDPCFVPFNCAEDLACIVQDGASTCQPLGDAGGPCGRSSDCKPEFYCHRDGDLGTCAPYAEPGESCIEADCPNGYWCRYSEDGSTASCDPVGAEGADCLSFGSAAGHGCQEGLFCVSTGLCAPAGALGDPCVVFDTESCAAGLYCSRETGLCAGPRARGETCNPLWPATCASSLGCHCGRQENCDSTPSEPDPSDTCEPRLDDGARCYRGAECDSGQCGGDAASGPTCQPAPADPEPCLGPP